MWIWEIIWQDRKGRKHSLFSLNGYETMGEAYTAYLSLDDSIKTKLIEMGSALIIDEQIVFKTSDELYPPDEIVR